MRWYLILEDVQWLFPDRSKSWAYKQLRIVREINDKKLVLLPDFADYIGITEQELLDKLGSKLKT